MANAYRLDVALNSLQRARNELDDAAGFLVGDYDEERDKVLELYNLVGQMMDRIRRDTRDHRASHRPPGRRNR